MFNFSASSRKVFMERCLAQFFCLLIGVSASMVVAWKANASSYINKTVLMQSMRSVNGHNVEKISWQNHRKYHRKTMRHSKSSRKYQRAYRAYERRYERRAINRRLRARGRDTTATRVTRRRHHQDLARRYRYLRPRPHLVKPYSPRQGTPPTRLGIAQTTPGAAGGTGQHSLVNCHVSEQTVSSYTPNDYAGACGRAEASARFWVSRQPGCRLANFINTRTWEGTRPARSGEREDRPAWFCKKTYRVCCEGVMRAPSPYGR